MPSLPLAELRRPSLKMTWGGSSDVGNGRTINEDAFFATPGLWVVADGMGGHEGGDVASKIVVDTGAEMAGPGLLELDDVATLVAQANDRVRDCAFETGKVGMGATVVGVALVNNGGDDALMVFNVGDSRCYSLGSDGWLNQLTTDHSLVQELLDAGEITPEEARSHSQRNVVSRAIGIEPVVAADFIMLPRTSPLRLLLCSDGVSGELSDSRIAGVLGAGSSPADSSSALLDVVLAGPARDNATALVLDVEWIDTNQRADDEITGPRPRQKAADSAEVQLIDWVPE